jgi:hypothetical protein
LAVQVGQGVRVASAAQDGREAPVVQVALAVQLGQGVRVASAVQAGQEEALPLTGPLNVQPAVARRANAVPLAT